MGTWPESMMYKEHYSPLGFTSKWDYWDCHENNEDYWYDYLHLHYGVTKHAVELIAEFDSLPNLTIDCIK